MYVRPESGKKNQPTTFGVSGKLWRDSLVMYDRDSRSLWSQLAGRAIKGQRKGESLQEYPAKTTSWLRWRTRYPDTLVLKPVEAQKEYELSRQSYAHYAADRNRTGVTGSTYSDDRLPAKELIYGLAVGDVTKAYPYSRLRAQPMIQDRLGKACVLILFDGDGAFAYRCEMDGRALTFRALRRDGGKLVLADEETGSEWEMPSAIATAGPLAGKELEALPGHAVYWFAWSAFYPKTAVWPDPGTDAAP